MSAEDVDPGNGVAHGSMFSYPMVLELVFRFWKGMDHCSQDRLCVSDAERMREGERVVMSFVSNGHPDEGRGQPIYPRSCWPRQCEYWGHSPVIFEPIVLLMSHKNPESHCDLYLDDRDQFC